MERKIKEWEWYHDKNTKILFLDMLLEARWKDSTYKGVVIKRGSFASSIRKLAKESDLTDNEVRTALKHLQKTGEITSKSHGKFTVFTITNYDLYQSDNTQNHNEITTNSQPINKQITSKSQAINEQLTHSIEEERKNVKEKKEKKECIDKAPEHKHRYGEYKHVLLTDKQYDKLVSDYGQQQLDEMIKILDEAIQVKGYSYRDHNLVLRGWVLKEYDKRKLNYSDSQTQIQRMLQDSYKMMIDWAEGKENEGQ